MTGTRLEGLQEASDDIRAKFEKAQAVVESHRKKADAAQVEAASIGAIYKALELKIRNETPPNAVYDSEI